MSRVYAEYAAHEHAWFPRLPRSWRTTSIGRLAIKIGSGKTPSGGADNYHSSGVLFLRSQNVHDEGLRLDDAVFIDEATDKAMAYSQVAASDVLLNITGASLGRTCLVPPDFATANVNQHVCIIRPQDPYGAAYLAYALKAPEVKAQIARSLTGAARDGLNFQQVANLQVALPPPAEQEAIAGFLDRETGKIDALVEEQRRLIVLLKEKRQAVISHAVTKGLDPSAPMTPSGIDWLGDIPAHWNEHRLASIFDEVAEPCLDEVPILSVSIHSGVSDEELDPDVADRKITRSEDRSKYKRVRPSDLTYNMMRAWQGAFGTVTVDGGVSPAYVVARPKGSAVITDYVEALLRTPMAIEEMRRNSYGVTDFRLRLYWDQFKQLRICLPPTDEQQAILSQVAIDLGRMTALSEEAKRAITLLEERRAALISAAVTGKIDVRGLAAEAEAA